MEEFSIRFGKSLKETSEFNSSTLGNKFISRELDGLTVQYQKKYLLQDEFWFENERELFVGTGTFCLPGLSSIESFKIISSGLPNSLKDNKIKGHFTFYHINKVEYEISIYNDGNATMAPFSLNEVLISSSFLNCCNSATELTLNTDLILYLIHTGIYPGAESVFNEINKLKVETTFFIRNWKISCYQLKSSKPNLIRQNQDQAVDSQINYLKDFFHHFRGLFAQNKSDLGLSSGYDSRLVLSLLKVQNIENYQLHSYWKSKPDKDNLISFKIADILNSKVLRIPISDRDTISQFEFDSQIKSAMTYYDGQFPSNHGWTREYRTVAHRLKILGNSKLGLSGIGGEIFRNDMGLPKRGYSFNYFIKNYILEGNNYRILKSNSSFKSFRNLALRYLTNDLNLKKTDRFDRNLCMDYYSHVWVQGGPGIRNRLENRLSYFLSPFSESSVIANAKSIRTVLGPGGEFQAKMITKLFPELAAIISDYGFSFNRISFVQKVKWYINYFIPRNFKKQVSNFFKGENVYLDSFGPHKNFILEHLNFLKSWGFDWLSADFELYDQDTMDRLIALSYVLKKYESKIKK